MMKIKVKKQFSFRELIQYIIENDISGEFRSDDGKGFRVKKYGEFKFYNFDYNDGGTYEIEVEEEITEDIKFDTCVINTEGLICTFHYNSIKESINKVPKATEIFARIDGKLQLVWQRGEDDDN